MVLTKNAKKFLIATLSSAWVGLVAYPVCGYASASEYPQSSAINLVTVAGERQDEIDTEVTVASAESASQKNTLIEWAKTEFSKNPQGPLNIIIDGSPGENAEATMMAAEIAQANSAIIVTHEPLPHEKSAVKRGFKFEPARLSVALLRGGVTGYVVAKTLIIFSQRSPETIEITAATLGTAALLLGYNSHAYLKFAAAGKNILAQTSRIFYVESAKFSILAVILALSSHGDPSRLHTILKVLKTAAEVALVKGSYDLTIEDLYARFAHRLPESLSATLRDLAIAAVAITDTALASASISGWKPAETALLTMGAGGIILLTHTKKWHQDAISHLSRLWRGDLCTLGLSKLMRDQ